MSGLFGKKPKKPKGPQGAAAAIARMEEEAEMQQNPLTARDIRMGVKNRKQRRAVYEVETG